MKIIFLGTPKFGSIILEGLCTADMKPVLVVTAPDRPIGRKQVITPPPVKIIAQNYGIPVIQPEKIQDTRYKIQNTKPDLIIVAAYGQILPKEILDIPPSGCLNVHASLLPRHRGPSPIQYAILTGDKETGVSIILMDGEIDHGPVISQKKTVVGPNETANELYGRLSVLGSELLVEIIPDWISDKIKAFPQNEEEATYTKILTVEDGEIDWKKPAQELGRQIRAFNPWPGAYTIWEKKIIRIKNLKNKIAENKKNKLKILKAALEKDKLIIKEVQPEGKKPMSFEDFLRGNPDFKIKC